MQCRTRCGACCIAISITTPLPGLPNGKPAGMHCPHLDDAFACTLWGDPARPPVCASFKPEALVCGSSQSEALQLLALLEQG